MIEKGLVVEIPSIQGVLATLVELKFLGPWLLAFVFSWVISIGVKLVLKPVSIRLRLITSKTAARWDDIAVDIVDGLKRWVLFAWVFYFLSKSLNPSPFANRVFQTFAVVAASFQVGLWGFYLIKSWRREVLEKRISEDPSSAAALGLLYTIIQTGFVLLVVLVSLSNLGINISALVAGLGVGGIAVALAAQNVLGDLLASLSIVLDKPFVVGDFVVAGSEMGTVQEIGIKTTRIRSLSGEEIILSNKDLVESRVQNFKRMRQRRVFQKFGVTYSTPPDVLEKIPGWARGIVEAQPKLKFDRCHLASYGPSSLDFEWVFFVLDADYNVYMDLQQIVLLELFRKFAAEKVEFAFPTQTVYVQGQSATP